MSHDERVVPKPREDTRPAAGSPQTLESRTPPKVRHPSSLEDSSEHSTLPRRPSTPLGSVEFD